MNAEEVRPNMQVFANGKPVGTVDHMDGDRFIKLKKKTATDGQHHWIPLDWVQRVDGTSLIVNKSEEDFRKEAMSQPPQNRGQASGQAPEGNREGNRTPLRGGPTRESGREMQTNATGQPFGTPMAQPSGKSSMPTSRPEEYREGPIARSIEQQTAKIPSDVFLWSAFGSIALSATLQIFGRKQASQFVGHWAPTLLILGLYNKLVKVAGSDRTESRPILGSNVESRSGEWRPGEPRLGRDSLQAAI